MLHQPEIFVLTREEARRLQELQLQRQAQFARRGPRLIASAIVATALWIGLLLAGDWVVFDGDMPLRLAASLFGAYLAGMFVLALVARMSLAETKNRMLDRTKEVWEPRTVEVRESGLSHVTASVSSLFSWSAIGPVEVKGDMLLLWFTKASLIAVPLRAFESRADALAFEAEARRRAGRQPHA